MSSVYDSGLIIAEKDMSVQSWLAKEDVRPTYYKNRVNAGLHVIDPKVLDMVAIDADKIGTVDKTTGEVPELKIECDCRKPKPGMLLKAADDYNIDLSQSYMIGDGENDIKAGLAAGCKAILVNGAGTDAKNEDFGQADTLSSVLEFVDKYLQ